MPTIISDNFDNKIRYHYINMPMLKIPHANQLKHDKVFLAKINAAKMSKRLCLSVDEVLERVLDDSDDEDLEDPDDPHEPILDGSDEDFDDLHEELEEEIEQHEKYDLFYQALFC